MDINNLDLVESELNEEDFVDGNIVEDIDSILITDGGCGTKKTSSANTGC